MCNLDVLIDSTESYSAHINTNSKSANIYFRKINVFIGLELDPNFIYYLVNLCVYSVYINCFVFFICLFFCFHTSEGKWYYIGVKINYPIHSNIYIYK